MTAAGGAWRRAGAEASSGRVVVGLVVVGGRHQCIRRVGRPFLGVQGVAAELVAHGGQHLPLVGVGLADGSG